jgi:hypothetical protein
MFGNNKMAELLKTRKTIPPLTRFSPGEKKNASAFD